MNNDKLNSVAKAIVAKQKDVLAADESNPTIKKALQFDQGRVHRRKIVGGTAKSFLQPKGLKRYVGGVILFDETLRQSTRDGTPLCRATIVPGDCTRYQGEQRRLSAGIVP